MKEEGKVRQELVRQRTVCWSGWKLILFWGGGRIGFFVVVVLMLLFFLTNSLYSALEHFWPIVAKSC